MAARSLFGGQGLVEFFEFKVAFNGGTADLEGDSDLGLIAGILDSLDDTFS